LHASSFASFGVHTIVAQESCGPPGEDGGTVAQVVQDT
jgi:hypothetical protein